MGRYKRSDGDGDLGGENAEDVLTDSMASAASQDQHQHLQYIAASDKTQEKKGVGPDPCWPVTTPLRTEHHVLTKAAVMTTHERP